MEEARKASSMVKAAWLQTALQMHQHASMELVKESTSELCYAKSVV